VKRFALFLLLCLTLPAHAALKVAVASNFKVTLDEIAVRYQQQTGQKIVIASASTGTLYNQIRHGAPFDLFLSADSERALLIEQSPLGIKGSRFTYAQGRLAFWQPKHAGIVDKNSVLNLSGRVAIANPKLAPYGLAAQQALQRFNLWSTLRYIKGSNISQTYQFIDTGNIASGFVAHSLLVQNSEKNYYLLPIDSYQPILQQGVILSNSKHQQAAQHFVDFLQSEAILKLIQRKGYL